MLILLISAVGSVILILAASILIIAGQPQKQEGELMRLSETAFTGLMGGMIIAVGFFLLYAKYANPAVAGTDHTSYIFVGCFALMSVAIGCGIMPYTFVKKIIAFEDRVLYITILGKHKELYWDKITEIKVPLLSNKATIIGENTRFSVGGEPKAYKKFIKIVQNKIGYKVGSDVFEKLLNRFMF